MKKFVFVAFFVLSSCTTQRFVLSEVEKVPSEADHEFMQQFFVYGIGQTQSIDTSKLCRGKKVSHVETTHSFLDVLLETLSGGLFAPRTAKVYCAD
jgi:hypothetical protein